MNVEICDLQLIRIAGSEKFKTRVGKNMALEGYVYQLTIEELELKLFGDTSQKKIGGKFSATVKGVLLIENIDICL